VKAMGWPLLSGQAGPCWASAGETRANFYFIFSVILFSFCFSCRLDSILIEYKKICVNLNSVFKFLDNFSLVLFIV
jgi:hypothetical protein